MYKISIVGMLCLMLGIMGQFLVNKGRQICILSAAVIFLLLIWLPTGGMKWPLMIVPVVDLAVAIADKWMGYMVIALLRIFIGASIFWENILELFQACGIVLGIIILIIAILELIAALFVIFTLLFPSSIMRLFRDNVLHNGNVEHAQTREQVLDHGIRAVCDLKYDELLPNGFLDIYYPEAFSQHHVFTVIYIHGGGYIWGDKLSDDPNGKAGGFENSTIFHLVNAGYPVISMNYALAPEFPYPCAVRQLNRGLGWLRDHAEKLEIDMKRVVLAGASAGGNLAGVLANIQTNMDYAKEIGVNPALSCRQLKAVIFEGGLMDNRYFGVTHNALFDYVFYHMGRVYLGVNELRSNRKVCQSGVTDYVTKDFPPSFISDGNTATFFDQARELAQRLNQLGVYTELSIFSEEEAGKLIHGFEESGSLWGEKTMQKMLSFLDKLTNVI